MINTRLRPSILRTKETYISKLAEMGIKTVKDLLLYFPRAYSNEDEFSCINNLRTDEVNVIRARVKSIFTTGTKTGKSITRAVVADETGELPVIWFNQSHLKRMFFKGSDIVLTGKLKYERGRSLLMSPKYEIPKTTLLHTGRIVPVYRESELITSKWLREKIYPLLNYSQYFEEHLPKWILDQNGLMSLADAIYHVHFAKDDEHLNKAKERLAFDEIFLLQFMAMRRKIQWRSNSKNEYKISDTNLTKFMESLPFRLTAAQKKTIDEITDDISSDYPMLRLIQGDVGSGKTVVAASAIYLAKHAGFQSALMAPTEILARQHYKTLMKLMSSFGFNIRLLTSSTPVSDRKEILRQIASGTCDLLIGTHSLIQGDVNFYKLCLVVIDEQHRFGVKQRETLKKSGTPHLLNMSATPIPRTMALTIYGDQDLSIINELPPGRQMIITRIVPESKRMDAYIWIRGNVRKGRQAFVICPLVEDSEQIEAKAAIAEFERLKNEIFKDERLALLHGRMKSGEKDEVMKKFAAGQIDILVSTSVVEVGIDIPNANIIVIEGADRFGLAQLHQFRGRVGRGEHQSYCFLFSDKNSDVALRRLHSVVKYNSGFDLAEIDLELRGPGEVYGVKQSGIPELKMANFSDIKLLSRARTAAEKLLAEDIELKKYAVLASKITALESKTRDYNA